MVKNISQVKELQDELEKSKLNYIYGQLGVDLVKILLPF